MNAQDRQFLKELEEKYPTLKIRIKESRQKSKEWEKFQNERKQTSNATRKKKTKFRAVSA